MTSWRMMGTQHERYATPEEHLHGVTIGETCFVVFSGTLFERIGQALPEFQPHPRWPFRRMPLVIDPAGVAVHFPQGGSPRAANLVEQLRSCGAKRLIGVGMCGALSAALQVGDVVAPVACVRGDAVSLHYAPPEFPAAANVGLLNAIASRLKERWRLHHGIQYSTDAWYRETYAQVQFWQELRVQSIDTEAAAFLAVSSALGVEAAWVGIVSDLLKEGRHVGEVSGLNVMDELLALFTALYKGGPL